jgi:membrane-associated protein
MSVFFNPLLSFLQAYGYPLLWLITFIAAAGAPLPMSLLLLAAGAFSAQGDFDVVVLVVIATSASVAGDCVGYLVGRQWGRRALDWLPRAPLGKRFITPQAIERSRVLFRRRGGWAIFLTRVLVSALGGVTNLVAGAESFPLRAFVLWDAAGEIISIGTTLGLGFAVGASWEAVGNIIGAIALFAIGLLCVVVLAQRLLRDLGRARAG